MYTTLADTTDLVNKIQNSFKLFLDRTKAFAELTNVIIEKPELIYLSKSYVCKFNYRVEFQSFKIKDIQSIVRIEVDEFSLFLQVFEKELTKFIQDNHGYVREF